MSLSSIPDGTDVFIDANILVIISVPNRNTGLTRESFRTGYRAIKSRVSRLVTYSTT